MPKKGQIEAQFLSILQPQMTLLEADHGWTVPELVYWLDRAIPHPDIIPTESGVFLTRLVRGLLNERGLGIEQLAHDKYRLKQAVAAKIDSHRQQAHQAAWAGGGAVLAVGVQQKSVIVFLR